LFLISQEKPFLGKCWSLKDLFCTLSQFNNCIPLVSKPTSVFRTAKILFCVRKLLLWLSLSSWKHKKALCNVLIPTSQQMCPNSFLDLEIKRMGLIQGRKDSMEDKGVLYPSGSPDSWCLPLRWTPDFCYHVTRSGGVFLDKLNSRTCAYLICLSQKSTRLI
jgi:hypothetical protein